MPRLFFPGVIGDTQRLQMRQTFEGTIPNEKGKGLERVCELLLRSRQNHCLQNNLRSLNVRYNSKLLTNLLRSAYICLAVPSLHYFTVSMSRLLLHV